MSTTTPTPPLSPSSPQKHKNTDQNGNEIPPCQPLATNPCATDVANGDMNSPIVTLLSERSLTVTPVLGENDLNDYADTTTSHLLTSKRLLPKEKSIVRMSKFQKIQITTDVYSQTPVIHRIKSGILGR